MPEGHDRGKLFASRWPESREHLRKAPVARYTPVSHLLKLYRPAPYKVSTTTQQSHHTINPSMHPPMGQSPHNPITFPKFHPWTLVGRTSPSCLWGILSMKAITGSCWVLRRQRLLPPSEELQTRNGMSLPPSFLCLEEPHDSQRKRSGPPVMADIKCFAFSVDLRFSCGLRSRILISHYT